MIITQSNNAIIVDSENVDSNKKVKHILQKVTTTTSTILQSNVTTKESQFTLSTDGWFRIYEYILPVQSTLTPPSINGVLPANTYYFYNDNIYRGTTLKTNDDIIDDDFTNTNLSGNTPTSIISLSYLEAYYIETIKSLLYKDMSCCNQDKQGVLKRDLLMMGISVIKQLAMTNRTMEAQRIIETLSNCQTTAPVGCGCNG